MNRDRHVYVWCAYRQWSFTVLEGLLDLPDWRCGLIVTTELCKANLDAFARIGIPVLRIDPRKDFKAGGPGHSAISALRPGAIFHYGWSWIVPREILDLCPNVTLHPGKLPRDRGGSPIQNQIRNGETWSYANIIRLVPGLDEGPIYGRVPFSLEGDEVDAVWARMSSAGIVATRNFLGEIAAGLAIAVPQDETIEPTLYSRVKPESAELKPQAQTARQIHDIVRAHNETDPNTYVVGAWLRVGSRKLTIDRATLLLPRDRRLVAPQGDEDWEREGYTLAHAINDSKACCVITGCDGIRVYATQVRLTPIEPLRQDAAPAEP